MKSNSKTLRSMVFVLIALLALASLASSQDMAQAHVDCGTLEGHGTVRLNVGGVVYRVQIDCGVRT